MWHCILARATMPPTYESTIKRIETLQCFNFPGHEKEEKKNPIRMRVLFLPSQSINYTFLPVSLLAWWTIYLNQQQKTDRGTYSFQGNAFPPQFASHRTTMLTSFIRHSSLFSSTFRFHPSKAGGLSGLTLLSTFF